MTVSTGDQLPDATLLRMGEHGPEAVSLHSLTTGRKVVIFGLPGAYTGTCSTAHVPSFIRTKPQFDDADVDEIVCISVNDPWVMEAWGKDTGATEAGLTMLGDPLSEFTKAIGMDFDAPPAGFVGRSKRYAMVVENNQVRVFQEEVARGVCDLSSGESLLAALTDD